MNNMKKILLLVFVLTLCMGVKAQETVQLPQPEIGMLGKSLGKILQERRSVREYQDKHVDLKILSTLLWAACGISDPASGKITAPSAVNMQDIKVYVCNKLGVALFNAKDNTLTQVSNENILQDLAAGQNFVLDAPFTLLLVSDQGNRRRNDQYGAMDAGYVSQNIYLACNAIGLSTVARAMMNKDAVRTKLNLPEGVIVELNHPIGYKK
jgi:nitroreductase